MPDFDVLTLHLCKLLLLDTLALYTFLSLSLSFSLKTFDPILLHMRNQYYIIHISKHCCDTKYKQCKLFKFKWIDLFISIELKYLSSIYNGSNKQKAYLLGMDSIFPRMRCLFPTEWRFFVTNLSPMTIFCPLWQIDHVDFSHFVTRVDPPLSCGQWGW